jgi:hypothetical protein
MNCDERQARPNRSVISRRRDRTFFLPAPVIGQSRHILQVRTVHRTGGRRPDAQGGGSSRIRRARRKSAQFRAGIIAEFIPGGNATVVVEFVSLIHHGKCRLCRRPSSKPMFTADGIVAVNVV